MARYVSECADCVEFGEFDFYDGQASDVIKTPGKFEHCADFVIHFYHEMLNGFGESCACGDVYFEIAIVDANLFPSLIEDVGDFVHIGVSEQGFVYTEIVTRDELDKHESEIEGFGDDRDFDA